MHSFRGLVSMLLASKARAGIASIFTLGFILVAFSSIGILLAEAGADGNIKTAEQALWWSLVTVTTVGYGDLYPVTTAGRTVAACAMIAGVGMFGAMSGVVASLLLGAPKDPNEDLLAEIRTLRAELAQNREAGSRQANPEPGTDDGRA